MFNICQYLLRYFVDLVYLVLYLHTVLRTYEYIVYNSFSNNKAIAFLVLEHVVYLFFHFFLGGGGGRMGKFSLCVVEPSLIARYRTQFVCCFLDTFQIVLVYIHVGATFCHIDVQRMQMEAYGCIWMHMDAYGRMMDTYGRICMHSNA